MIAVTAVVAVKVAKEGTQYFLPSQAPSDPGPSRDGYLLMAILVALIQPFIDLCPKIDTQSQCWS